MTIPITGHTKLIGLLGDPVAHSISPMMHNESFRLLGLDYVYLCFRVNEDTLPHVVTGLRDAGIRGFNLTMPCKNQMVQLCDHLSPAARLIGAVNTVVCDDGVSPVIIRTGSAFGGRRPWKVFPFQENGSH